MSSTLNVSMVFQFADNTTKTFTIENAPAENLIDFKDNVQDINDNVDGRFAPFYETFVSKSSIGQGARFTKITEAKVTSIEEEVIYNG